MPEVPANLSSPPSLARENLASHRLSRPLAAVAVLAGLGALAFALIIAFNQPRGPSAADVGDKVQLLSIEPTNEHQYIQLVAGITRSRVLEQVRPAIKRAQLTASDPTVVDIMRRWNKAEATALANRIVRGATEVDVVALFDANGSLGAFNSCDASGMPFPAEAVADLYTKSFEQREVISSCLRGSSRKPALEFQMHCDFTPALHNSVGLSVAYSTPVIDPDSRVTLGVVSVRMWFDRLLDVLPPSGQPVQVVLVSDSGEVFEESITRTGAAFPIPPETVKQMMARLDDEGHTKALFVWQDLAADLTLVPDDATIANGGLHVLSYANHDWVAQQARQSRTTMALAGGAASLLALCASTAIIWLLQRRQLSRRLQDAESAAVAANQAKSEFLAAISHEIRTPMNGVVGMADVLMQTHLRPNQLELANSIRSSATALCSIVGGILDFSKIEAGKLDLLRESISPVEVIEGACVLLAPTFDSKRVLFQHFVHPSIPALIEGDANRLRQVLLNLLGNALKFSSGLPRRGRVRLEATTTHRDDLRVNIRVKIEDNGIGMSPAVMAELFRPFQQAGAASRGNRDGTGLGLVISQRLLRLMGGDIEVESEPDRGSTFTINLECALPHQPPPGHSPVAGASVLVVGHDRRRVADLVTILDAAGAETHTAVSLGAECRAQACVWAHDPEDGWTTEDLRSQSHRAIQEHGGITGQVVVLASAAQLSPPYRTAQLVQLNTSTTTRDGLLLEVAAAIGRAAPAIETDAPTAGVHRSPAQSIPGALHGGRILVIEDNEANQDAIRTQMEVLGYSCDIAANADTALSAWRHGSYDLVLCDLLLPGIDGLEFARVLRREETQSGRLRVPILALADNLVQGTAALCREAGMDDYLTKPMLVAELGNALEQWLTCTEKSEDVQLDALQAQVGDNEPLIARLLEEYCRQSPGNVAELERAFMAQELGHPGEAAHKLKSSSRAVGALAVALTCQELESTAHQSTNTSASVDLSKIRGPLSRLRVQWHQAAARIRQRLHSRTAGAALETH